MKPISKEVLDEIDEHLKNQELIFGDRFDSEAEKQRLIVNRSDKEKYEYSPLCINLKDIKTFNSADPTHISLRLYGGESFVVKCDYETFRGLYQFFTGSMIHDFTNPSNFKLMFSDGEQQGNTNKDG